jgi:uncharacterized protein involved in response to NO
VAIFAYGFRPFFLLAAIHAALVIPFWVALLNGLDLGQPPLPALAWHAHEMLYGFVAAAIAGFLLTAVPSWTGRRGYAGAPLVLLVLAWLAGRVAMSLPLGLSPIWLAVIDLAFLPLLAMTLIPALIRAGNRRNLALIGLLALLFAANLAFHLDGAASSAALMPGFTVMLFMLTLLGGRMVPVFTSSALKQRGFDIRIRRYQPLDSAVLIAVALVALVEVLMPPGLFAAGAAGIAAILLAAQLCRWQGHRTLREPIVWVLHVAYAWLPVCLAIKSAWLLGVALPASSWQHALGVGAMATMIIAVMSRASLGHTGRELVAPMPIVAAYGLLSAAALARVFGPMLMPLSADRWQLLAAGLWTLAFSLFVIVYAPILWRSRADCRPG